MIEAAYRSVTVEIQIVVGMQLGFKFSFLAVALGGLAWLMLAILPTAAQTTKTGASGLPVPRFVSLKSDRVNVRLGPSRDHEIGWIFVRTGLPVEVIQEFENWRRIRDSEGAEGWVFHSLLSGRRTALVTPWQEGVSSAVRTDADAQSRVTALLEPKVLATVSECAGNWCKVSGKGWSGWIEQAKLWGVYKAESFD